MLDAETNLPIAGAELRSTDFLWNYGEYVSTSDQGRFHLWLPTGTWAIAVNASGYVGAVVPAMEASRETGVEHTFTLTRLK